jgi:hypothetical protein
MHRHSGPMVQVRTLMVLVMVCLMSAGPIRGFVGALALGEVSDEAEAGVADSAEAGAAVAAEPDLVIGSIFNPD